MRSFGFDLITTGQFMGSLLLVGGTAGVFAGGWLADRLGAADKRWYARLPAIASLITAPTFAAGLLVPMPAASWVLRLRSAERRAGQGCVGTCRDRWWLFP